MTARETTPLRVQVLRRFNPLIRCMLRSPVHGPLSRDLLVLEYRATAERVPSDSDETRAAFECFLVKNPGTARLLYNVRIDARGAADAGDLAREIHASVVVRLQPSAAGS